MTAPPREVVVDWIRIAAAEGVGPATFKALLTRFGTAARAIAELPATADRLGRRKKIEFMPVDDAAHQLDRAERNGFSAIIADDSRYPALLREIDDRPPVIWVKGNIDALSAPCIGIVGARNATLNGRKFAKAVSAELAAAGLSVVSGMARGIDGAAHEGALSSGKTVAVLAGGPDVIYPPEHRDLWSRIAGQGAVVSEMPLGTEPIAAHFPRRNRIISGLSVGIVVIEATPKSGSLITARYALDQGREVCAVPGSPLDPRAQGPNGLIREGATLVQSADDILEACRGTLGSVRAPVHQSETLAQPSDLYHEIDSEGLQSEILALLGSGPVGVDELVRQCQVSAPAVAQALLDLELAGRIERFPGNRVGLIGKV